MAKKLSLLLAGAAVFAFAAPALANAATGLTESGKLVATGQIITGTNIGAVKITSEKLGDIECKTLMWELELVTNTTSEVTAELGGTSTATSCTRAGAAVKEDVEMDHFASVGGGTGGTSEKFKVELTPGGTVCTFVGTNDVVTYTSGSDVLRISNQPLKVSPLACGTSASFDGEFTLTTQNTTTPLFLD